MGSRDAGQAGGPGRQEAAAGPPPEPGLPRGGPGAEHRGWQGPWKGLALEGVSLSCLPSLALCLASARLTPRKVLFAATRKLRQRTLQRSQNKQSWADGPALKEGCPSGAPATSHPNTWPTVPPPHPLPGPPAPRATLAPDLGAWARVLLGPEGLHTLAWSGAQRRATMAQ